jgi:hypothetical protein
VEPYKIEGTVKPDGTLTLANLPFPAGERVERTVAPVATPAANGNRYPLRGSVIRFDSPTAPVGEADWEASS